MFCHFAHKSHLLCKSRLFFSDSYGAFFISWVVMGSLLSSVVTEQTERHQPQAAELKSVKHLKKESKLGRKREHKMEDGRLCGYCSVGHISLTICISCLDLKDED